MGFFYLNDHTVLLQIHI